MGIREDWKKRFTCPHVVQDGAGHYCQLISIPEDKKEDYPHKFWRVMCFGIKNSLNCKRELRKGWYGFFCIREKN